MCSSCAAFQRLLGRLQCLALRRRAARIVRPLAGELAELDDASCEPGGVQNAASDLENELRIDAASLISFCLSAT